MSLSHSPKIVTNGLILCLDAANPKSYPGSGTTFYDLSGKSKNCTINGTISYVNSGSSSYFDFATASDSNYIFTTANDDHLDCTIVFYPDFSRVGGSNIAGILADSTAATSLDNSLRFTSVNGTGPWTLTGRNPGDANDWAYLTATNYYINGQASTTTVSGWNILGGYRTNQTSYPKTGPLYIGTSGYAGRGFQGRIAAVYIYNRELTAAEQLQNFNALRGRYGL